MMRTKFILLLIAGFSVFSSLTRAEPPQNYTVSYAFKNPDGTLFRVIKYYLLDGLKFRTGYYSYAAPVEYNVSVEAESQLDSAAVKEGVVVKSSVTSDAGSQAADLSNIEPHTIQILRNDKKLVWTISPEFKKYSEVSLRPDSWERSVTGLLLNSYPDLKKTGEIKLLDYPCDVYENVQTDQENNWRNIVIAAHGLDVVLKTELWKNSKLVQTMEATEFSTKKPASSLFEVPGGYQKNDNN